MMAENVFILALVAASVTLLYPKTEPRPTEAIASTEKDKPQVDDQPQAITAASAVVLSKGVSEAPEPQINGEVPRASGKVQWVCNIGEAYKLAEADGKPIFLHFTAGWCAPCQELKKIFQSEEFIMASKGFHCVTWDIGARRVPKSWGVRNVPLDVAILMDHGKPTLVGRETGCPSTVEAYLLRLSHFIAAISKLKRGVL